MLQWNPLSHFNPRQKSWCVVQLTHLTNRAPHLTSSPPYFRTVGGMSHSGILSGSLCPCETPGPRHPLQLRGHVWSQVTASEPWQEKPQLRVQGDFSGAQGAALLSPARVWLEKVGGPAPRRSRAVLTCVSLIPYGVQCASLLSRVCFWPAGINASVYRQGNWSSRARD